MKPPAFQFYVDDFLGGTMHFSDAEVGLYIRLLCVQWSTGFVVDNDEEIASYGKGNTQISRVKLKFEKCKDGNLRNKRMEVVREKQVMFNKSRKANGKLGGRPCKASDNLVVLKGEATESSPTPTPTPFDKRNKGTLEEVQKKVKSVGLAVSDAEWFWNKCEGNGWTNNGEKIKSWAHVVTAWKTAGYFPSQKQNSFTSPRTANGASQSQTDKIILGKEYDRVIERQRTLRATYGDHQTWSEPDRVEWGKLKARKTELKTILGITV